ncbi:hypothetical protein AGMMS49990_01570 [Endomicrobiia bacterium]|nr:hypothetical protein AGMMS49990_01570 [Endomicrobiia bacterium]
MKFAVILPAVIIKNAIVTVIVINFEEEVFFRPFRFITRGL